MFPTTHLNVTFISLNYSPRGDFLDAFADEKFDEEGRGLHLLIVVAEPPVLARALHDLKMGYGHLAVTHR